MSQSALYIASLLTSGVIAVFLGFLFAPSFIRLIYDNKLWRQNSRALNTTNADFHKIANDQELSIPRVGGALIIAITGLSILVLLFST